MVFQPAVYNPMKRFKFIKCRCVEELMEDVTNVYVELEASSTAAAQFSLIPWKPRIRLLWVR